MQLDVFFTPAEVTPADVSGRVVAIVDVLRASTSIAVALANGARAVIPFESSEEVVTRAKNFDRGEVRLAGERKGLPIPGFDLGNSPRDFTRDAVEGKAVLMSTTNGTSAFQVVAGARDVVVASYVNFTAALTMLRTALRGDAGVAIICAGRDRQFSLEDAACAGRYVYHVAKRLSGVHVNDAAVAARLLDKKYGDNLRRLFEAASHGQALIQAGFSDDLDACAQLDAFPVLPVYQDRQITKLGPDRER